MLKPVFTQAAQKGPDARRRTHPSDGYPGPSEAYFRYAAMSAQASQRRRWAFFSSLLGCRMEEADRAALPGEPVSELPRCLPVARPFLGVRGEDLAPDRDALIHELLA
jgi:hypothetical protein